MAKQYLAAPAGVERVFSAAGRMHNDLRKSTLEHSLFIESKPFFSLNKLLSQKRNYLKKKKRKCHCPSPPQALARGGTFFSVSVFHTAAPWPVWCVPALGGCCRWFIS